MAGKGPAPKGDRQRERDTRRSQAGLVTIASDGVLRGPELPDKPNGWHPQTLEWWDTWRRSPQAQLFEPTDWEVLKRAALLHDYVWNSPKPSAAAISELRLIEERFGATYVDRQRARIKISKPGDDAPKAPKAAPGAGLRARMQEGRKGQK